MGFKIIVVPRTFSAEIVSNTDWFSISRTKKCTLVDIHPDLRSGLDRDCATTVAISGLQDLDDADCFQIYADAGKGILLCEALLRAGQQRGIEFVRNQFKHLMGL